MNRERLKRIRNHQSTDWYPAVFMRPLCILIMLVVADWSFLTPNRLTHLGNLTKIAAITFLLQGDWSSTVAAVVLIQAGLLFDHLDGTMARYRRTFTSFGSYYDKVSDGFLWFGMVMAAAWIEVQRTGQGVLLVVAAGATYAMVMHGYIKWLAQSELSKLDMYRVRAGESALIEARTTITISEPPARTAAQWLRWYGLSWLRILLISETDLYFWLGLAMLVRRVDIFLWGLAGTQTLGALIRSVQRGLDMHRVDAALERLRKTS